MNRRGHGTSGLSHFADVASGEDRYPVRRRGEPRRLNPNWTGITWLEAQSLEDTKPIRHVDMGDGLAVYVTDGYYLARRRGAYPGPMFKIVLDLPLDPGAVVCDDPCPVCDDFSRTARCPDHPEKQAGEWIPSQMPTLRDAAPAPTPGTVRTAPLGTPLAHLITEQQEGPSPLDRFIAEQTGHTLAGRHQIVLDGVEVTFEEARDA